MNVYFSGIGGVGIGPLALLALDVDYQVHGSDREPSELSELVATRGVNIAYQQTGEHLKKIHESSPIDWFVYSSALPEDHPELSYAKKHGIKTSKRANFLKHILKERELKLIAVSGTHGKTTTTGMLIWLFKQLGQPLSYSIGTTLSFGPPARYQNGSKYFVYECDEFDRNFLEFEPELSLIPSLDYDHPDTYPTEASYEAAFRQFVDQSKLTVTWESIAEKIGSQAQLFVVPDSQIVSSVELAGEHIRRNAWLAAVSINRLGLVQNDLKDWEQLLKKLGDFPGTMRRFEKLAENFYSDYAHHPVEIAATIEMARELNKEVVVIYQPHQNIRQHELLAEEGYATCFEGVKKLYWLPTYLSREYKKLELLTPKELLKTVRSSIDAEAAEMNATLSQKIKDHLQAGDIVVGMSAGDLDAWLRKFA